MVRLIIIIPVVLTFEVMIAGIPAERKNLFTASNAQGNAFLAKS